MKHTMQRDRLLKILWLAAYGFLWVMAFWLQAQSVNSFSPALKDTMLIVAAAACLMFVGYPIAHVIKRRVQKKPFSPLLVATVLMFGLGSAVLIGFLVYVEVRPCTLASSYPLPCEVDSQFVWVTLGRMLLVAGGAGIIFGTVTWLVRKLSAK